MRYIVFFSLLFSACFGQTVRVNIDSASIEDQRFLKPHYVYHELITSPCNSVSIECSNYFTLGGIQALGKFKRLGEWIMIDQDDTFINTAPLGTSTHNQLTNLFYPNVMHCEPNGFTRMPHKPDTTWTFDLCYLNPSLSETNQLIILVCIWEFVDPLTGWFTSPPIQPMALTPKTEGTTPIEAAPIERKRYDLNELLRSTQQLEGIKIYKNGK